MRSEIRATDQNRRSFIEEARRAQIIECAIETIAELGYGQASLARIAKRAEISAGVISYYFAGKDELIREVLAHVFAVGGDFIRLRAEGRADARSTLRAFIEAGIGFIGERPHYARAAMNIIHAGRAEAGASWFDPSVLEPRQATIGAILAWGQREGEFRAFSAPVMVATIIEALDAVPPQLAVQPDLDLQAYAAELADLFELATRRSQSPPSRGAGQ
ncbi:MAG: TetR family transcriptional regulator [Caulobacterales bacterium]